MSSCSVSVLFCSAKRVYAVLLDDDVTAVGDVAASSSSESSFGPPARLFLQPFFFCLWMGV